ncbi:MAG: hypothetical protein MJ252_29055, partial [archaeon]|nr:hypothetical protein [archaeon]
WNGHPEESELPTTNPDLNEDEKGKCPFGFDKPKKSEKKEESEKCPFGFTSADKRKEDEKKTQRKCPFGYTSSNDKGSPSTNEEEKDSSEEEDKPRGGCPVMNKGKKDPQNKHFEPFYEIPCYGNYDFIFLLRGTLSLEEWAKKTEKLRTYPRHLRYTLFYQAQEKLQMVHTKEFPMVFFIYDDIKQKALRLYRRKKYKEAIEHMTYAYGLLRWIQFKDKKRQSEFMIKPSLDGILDEDIELKEVFIDDPKVLDDSYRACKVFLLEIMAYAHMELREYSVAIECLDECVEVAEDKVADVYFRRSQARTYNKFSKAEDYEKAMKDIEKAIELKPEEEIYKQHKEILEKIINDKAEAELNSVRNLIEKIKRKREKIKELHLEINDMLFASREDCDRQYKILKEMKDKYKLAVKFFTETKNEEQLALTYKEYEKFQETYQNFKFYYKFNLVDLNPKVKQNLTEEEISLLENEECQKYIDEYKCKACENIFSDGNFNLELFQYALEKVFGEERKEEEEREKEEEAKRPKVSWMEWIGNISKGNFGFYFTIFFVIVSALIIGGHFYMYANGAKGASGLGGKFK